MKRLFFFLIVVVASVLPQIAWAADPTTNEASLDESTGVLTITSTQAGNLHGGNVSGFSSLTDAQKLAVTKIELIGYFNANDLTVLKGRIVDGDSDSNGKFLNVTEVDMSEAQFVLADNQVPSQAYYFLYNTGATLPSGTTGDRAIIGGTLYKSAQNGQWKSVSPAEGTYIAVDNVNTSVTTGYAIGTYGKNNGVAKYVQMHVTAHTWSGPFTKGYDNFAVPSSATQLTASSFADETTVLNGQLDNYYGGQFVYFNRYYKTQFNSTTNQYEWVEWDEGTEDNFNNATGNKYNDPSGINLNELSIWYANQGDHPEGNVMLVKVYYQKQDNSKEWVDPTPENPAETEFATDMSAYEYEYRDNHMEGYKNGEWVKLTKWEYYQFQATSGWHWELVSSYNDGDGYYINKKYPYDTNMSSTTDGLPNADNQYAVKMGSKSGDGEYYRNGSSWKDPEEATNTPHYVDMKFSYWSSTLQKATTSKYADEDINPDIFQNCNKLTEVDFKAGVVKGFTDHNTSYGLTVNIGQNVTKIASDAFIRCNDLETLTFDAGIDVDNISGKTYPLALEIRDGAFQACENLKNVVIPNRVTVIGNDAFKEAGGKTAGTEFKVTFQRRYTDSTPKTAIDGWKEGMNLTIGTDAFAYCKNLKEISLPIRMTSMGDGIFQNSGLEKYEIREDIEEALVTTIPSNAFLKCRLTNINIPRSVTEIEAGAFSNTPTIKTIRFQKQLPGYPQTPLIIRTGAFSGGDEDHQELKDVYVDFTPGERLVVCEYDAFNYTSMVGQTNVANAKFAKLHFPDESWNYYQGDWKRGLAFRQTNLTAYKDGYTGKFGGIESEANCTGKSTSNNLNYSDGFYRANGSAASSAYDRLVAPANGWQQFVYSDSEIEIEITRGSFMRTYSTNTAYVIPTFAEDDHTYNITAGDPMFKIHRIIAFSDGWEVGDDPNNTTTAQGRPRVATAREVVLKDHNERRYIPQETGLMMVGKVNADYVAYFANADFTSMTQTTYPFNVTTYANEDSPTNLLYPTCIDELNLIGDGLGTQTNLAGQPSFLDDTHDRILLNSTIPYPYYNVSEVLFRLFGYAPSQNKFIRTEGATSTRDKAYLKLPAAMFHWTSEYNGNESSGSGSGVDQPTVPAGTRTITLDFIDDEESEITGIKQANTTTQRMDSNVFYTLEGVRLNARPTQRGIYIHNGRKIVIK